MRGMQPGLSNASDATLAMVPVTHNPAGVERSSDAGNVSCNASVYTDSSMTSGSEEGDATTDFERILSTASNASDATSAMAPVTYAPDDVVHTSNGGNVSAITYDDSESNAGNATELILSTVINAGDATSAMAPAAYAHADVNHSSHACNTSAIIYDDSSKTSRALP